MEEAEVVEAKVQNSFDLEKFAYLAGFFDAEGCVYIGVEKKEAHSVGYTISPKLKIEHAHDQELEGLLERFCDSNDLDYRISEAPRDHPTDKFIWKVSNRESVRQAAKLLLPLCTHKNEQLKVLLREILPRLSNKEHTSRNGFLEVVAWKDVLDSEKAGKRGKYNLRYFEQEWGIELDRENAGLPEDWSPDYNRPKRRENDD